jgi:hypothetical protein
MDALDAPFPLHAQGAGGASFPWSSAGSATDLPFASLLCGMRAALAALRPALSSQHIPQFFCASACVKFLCCLSVPVCGWRVRP